MMLCNNMKKEIIEKVVLQFKGEIRSLTGEDAKKWYDANNAMAGLSYIHGMPFPELNWEITERKPYDKKRKKTPIKRSKKN